MKDKIDAPICFEGIVFIKDNEGHTAEVSITFGYGSVPTADDVARMVRKAITSANKSTGRKWTIPSPNEFMERAARKEYGMRVAGTQLLEDSYSMTPNDPAVLPDEPETIRVIDTGDDD